MNSRLELALDILDMELDRCLHGRIRGLKCDRCGGLSVGNLVINNRFGIERLAILPRKS